MQTVAMRTSKAPLFQHEKNPCGATTLAETFALIAGLELVFTAEFLGSVMFQDFKISHVGSFDTQFRKNLEVVRRTEIGILNSYH